MSFGSHSHSSDAHYPYCSSSKGLNATLQAITSATRRAITALCDEGHPAPIWPSKSPLFRRVWIGLAGAGRSRDINMLRPKISDFFALPMESGSLRLTNDAFLLSAAIEARPAILHGVVLICGTGSLALALRREASGLPLRQYRREGGFGHLLDDSGSAWSMGRLTVLSTLAAGTRGSAFSRWQGLILAQFNVDKSEDLLSACMYLGPDFSEVDRKIRIAECARIVCVAAYQEQDEEAMRIVKRNVSEVIDLVRPLMESPQAIQADETLLVMAGGLCGNDYFQEHIIREMSAQGWTLGGIEHVKSPAEVACSFLFLLL